MEGRRSNVGNCPAIYKGRQAAGRLRRPGQEAQTTTTAPSSATSAATRRRCSSPPTSSTASRASPDGTPRSARTSSANCCARSRGPRSGWRRGTTYALGYERADFERFLAGSPVAAARVDWWRPWLDQISRLTAKGKTDQPRPRAGRAADRLPAVGAVGGAVARRGRVSGSLHAAQPRRTSIGLPLGHDWWLLDDERRDHHVVHRRWRDRRQDTHHDPGIVARYRAWRDLAVRNATPAEADRRRLTEGPPLATDWRMAEPARRPRRAPACACGRPPGLLVTSSPPSSAGRGRRSPKIENGRQMPTDSRHQRRGRRQCGHPDADPGTARPAQRTRRLCTASGGTSSAPATPRCKTEFDALVRGAKRIRNFEVLLIPGLLQTPDYARYRALEAVRLHGTAAGRRRGRPSRRGCGGRKCSTTRARHSSSSSPRRRCGCLLCPRAGDARAT